MPSISKPRVEHPGLPRNALGLTRRDYEGAMSTLCAGCGHDSVTAAIVQTFWELEIEPHRVAKLSGIGCSSKTPNYFLNQAHGFNTVHGRMPAVASGAAAANRELVLIGISGDGDSLSIGLGQLCHAIRRNVNLAYVLENNGVYGLTKGQFSASADVGSKAKRGEANALSPIDPVLLALTVGASFVARGFSGDKEQLVPLLKAAVAHGGFALVDVISPCVTFNDHEGSTKSYRYTRERVHEMGGIDFVPLRSGIEVAPAGDDEPRRTVRMHDGSVVHFQRVPDGYDPHDRDGAYAFVRRCQEMGEVPTGLLYIDPVSHEMHEVNGTVAEPLHDLPWEELCPGAAALEQLMEEFG
jgi:2-oxoglutarate/2-oxoacid ferredoxin oxidoreductase subunit beta